MSDISSPMHRPALRPWLVAAAGLLVLIGGTATVQLRGGHWRDWAGAPAGMSEPGLRTAAPARPHAARQSAEGASRAPAPLAQPPAPQPEPGVKPSFDVVRVNPSGLAVMAGRAAPGAEVSIADAGHELGRIKADDQGQWVFLPAAPLSPGGRALTLSARTAAGTEQRSDSSVLLVVPERRQELAAVNPVPPLAVLTPDNPSSPAAVRLLQPPPPAGIGAAARLGLDVVQYVEHGTIGFAGSAPPRAAVRLYIDNRKVGDATADATGRWSLTPAVPVSAGRHHVRVDQLAANGRVTARTELPFTRENVLETTVAKGRVIVQPGQNLWRLARNAYGSGLRYTVIYQANRDHIRDPRLIYPGQNFAMPDAPAAVAPAAISPAAAQ